MREHPATGPRCPTAGRLAVHRARERHEAGAGSVVGRGGAGRLAARVTLDGFNLAAARAYLPRDLPRADGGARHAGSHGGRRARGDGTRA